MKTIFSSPQAYLENLQVAYAKPYAENTVQDHEFDQLTKKAAKQSGTIVPPGPTAGIALAIRETFQRVLDALNSEERKLIDENVAVGVVENGEPNAFIARSENGKFAILFSSGLALFLHKYVKLAAALSDPKSIVYCNRKDAATVPPPLGRRRNIRCGQSSKPILMPFRPCHEDC